MTIFASFTWGGFLKQTSWKIELKEAIFWSKHELQWPTNPPEGKKKKGEYGKIGEANDLPGRKRTLLPIHFG